MKTEVIVEAKGLGKRFGQNRVLDDLDLSVTRGMVVGLLGTNGSGKSTLIKCLLGLLKPTSGIASILGEDSWNLSGEAKARLGYVPQDVKLYPWMTASQVISLYSRLLSQVGLHIDRRSGSALGTARGSTCRPSVARTASKARADLGAGTSARTTCPGRARCGARSDRPARVPEIAAGGDSG